MTKGRGTCGPGEQGQCPKPGPRQGPPPIASLQQVSNRRPEEQPSINVPPAESPNRSHSRTNSAEPESSRGMEEQRYITIEPVAISYIRSQSQAGSAGRDYNRGIEEQRSIKIELLAGHYNLAESQAGSAGRDYNRGIEEQRSIKNESHAGSHRRSNSQASSREQSSFREIEEQMYAMNESLAGPQNISLSRAGSAERDSSRGTREQRSIKNESLAGSHNISRSRAGSAERDFNRGTQEQGSIRNESLSGSHNRPHSQAGSRGQDSYRGIEEQRYEPLPVSYNRSQSQAGSAGRDSSRRNEEPRSIRNESLAGSYNRPHSQGDSIRTIQEQKHMGNAPFLVPHSRTHSTGSSPFRGIEQMNYISNELPISLPPFAPEDEQLPEPIEDPMCTERDPRVIPFEAVTAASFKIKTGVMRTPCDQSHLHRFTSINIFLKKEFMQYTGSFKERGARNALLLLSDEEKEKGVVTASAGNHSQALAYHARQLNIPVTVVMPVIAPIMKIQNCRALGANVIVKGKDMSESKLWAMDISKKREMVYINGYDHPHVIAGQGTCGLEILEQIPDVDAIVIPVGGGGLIAGMAVAIKGLKPSVRIIGVESSECPGFAHSIKAGKPVQISCKPTIADGLSVPLVGFNAFATATPLIDRMVEVQEEWIALAILRLIELEKCIVEGASATTVAAILAGHLDDLAGKKVVLVLSGGNIDTTLLGRVIERGLAADNRFLKFTVEVVDRPGGLQELCFLLGSLGVSVKDILQERAWIRSDIFKVRVKVLCEVRDSEHAKQLQDELMRKYDVVRFGELS